MAHGSFRNLVGFVERGEFHGLKQALILGLPVLLSAVHGPPLRAADVVTDLAAEFPLIGSLQEAAWRGDDAFVDARLGYDLDALPEGGSASAVLARRAMAVCGWLRNDNEHGRALRLAERVVARIAPMRETSDGDRVERLYWEAMLLGDVLDRKAEALARLLEAEALAPEDDRILQSAQQLAQALGAFGR